MGPWKCYYFLQRIFTFKRDSFALHSTFIFSLSLLQNSEKHASEYISIGSYLHDAT